MTLTFQYRGRNITETNIEGINMQTQNEKGYKAYYHDFKPPTKTTVLSAMHLCPAAPKPAAAIAFKVASMFASGMTIA